MTRSDVSAGKYSESMIRARADSATHCMALLGTQHAFFTTYIVINGRPDHWIIRPSTDRTNPPSGLIPGVLSEELYFRLRHDWGPGEYNLDWTTEVGAFVLFGYNYRKDGVQYQSEESTGTLHLITASDGVLAGTFEATTSVPLDDGSKVTLKIQDGSFHFSVGSAL